MKNELPELRPNFGMVITFQHNNQWGQPCANIYDYIYAGEMGKYPDYNIRFTRIGDGRIAPDKYLDIFITSENCAVGKGTSLGKIIKANYLPLSSPELVEVVAKAF